jgi:glyoxylase-like metal-dependent hydrolase (beta-lactamase superfamily II)
MPRITRRTCLAMTASAALLPKAAFTAERFDLGGGAELVTLSDGHLTLPPDFIFGPAPQEELAELAPELGIDPAAELTPPCNVTLMRTGDRTVLFDCGSGHAFMPSAGRLMDALSAEGLTPDDVTDIVFTHGHPDHLWGVLDDFDLPMFMNATHWMGRAERDYWMDPETIDTIGEARASFAAGAARRIPEIEGMMETFEDGDEMLPGIAAHMTPGHTPGHMSFEVSTGGDTVMIIGDAIANDHVAVARPGWPSGSDHDTEMGAQTRVRLIERLAQEQMVAVGFHMGGGGIGRIEPAGEGYRFVTEI